MRQKDNSSKFIFKTFFPVLSKTPCRKCKNLIWGEYMFHFVTGFYFDGSGKRHYVCQLCCKDVKEVEIFRDGFMKEMRLRPLTAERDMENLQKVAFKRVVVVCIIIGVTITYWG